jgi:hypothetical protein
MQAKMPSKHAHALCQKHKHKAASVRHITTLPDASNLDKPPTSPDEPPKRQNDKLQEKTNE